MSTNTISPQNNFSWIHLNNMRYFIYLGANEYEKKIGQNIIIDLSLKIQYENTQDKLENTLDYGLIVSFLKEELERLNGTNLLEYLAEQLLIALGAKFQKLLGAKLMIQKGYAPLQNFTGTVKFEVEKNFKFF